MRASNIVVFVLCSSDYLGYDGLVKVWDIRSSIPLSSQSPPESSNESSAKVGAAAVTDYRVLCVDFLSDQFLCGGTDTQVHSFSPQLNSS